MISRWLPNRGNPFLPLLRTDYLSRPLKTGHKKAPMTIRFIFLLLLTTALLTAQSPYELKWKQESAYLGLGLAMTGFDLYQNPKVIQPLTLYP